MTYLFLFGLYFYLPGWILSRFLGIEHLRLPLAFAISYFLQIATLIPLKYLGGGVAHYSALIHLQIGLIILVYLWRIRGQQGVPILSWGSVRAFRSIFQFRNHTQSIVVGGSILLPIALYLLLVGPYTEVPADAWHHLGQFQHHYSYLLRGDLLGLAEMDDVFTKYAGYWYFIHAYIAYSAGLTIAESMLAVTLATSISFLLAVYAFSSFVLTCGGLPKREVAWVAALSVLLYFIQFGVNIFSYIRYYAFAPTILNFVVYFSAIGLLIQFIRGYPGTLKLIILMFLHLLLLGAVHMQEALFFIVAFSALTFVYFAEASATRLNSGLQVIFETEVMGKFRARVMFSSVCIVSILVYLYSYMYLDRNNPLGYGRMIPVEDVLPFIKHMYVLKFNGDFYQVVGMWGIFVYIIFFSFFRQFRQFPYLIAGMLIPVLTVFNPLFTDLFLRVSWPELLWRICFLIPLPLVAALIVFKSCQLVLSKGYSVSHRAVALTIVFLSVFLIFPINSTYIVSKVSRIYTLTKVNEGNNYTVWSDLIMYLSNSPYKRVLTDPVTGYVLKGMTSIHYRGYKFHRVDYNQLNFEHYDNNTFSAYDNDWLLVINKRNGKNSENGKRSGHWSEETLQVSQYYSEGLLQHVINHPNIFEPVWQQDSITVYRMNQSG